MRQGMKQVKFIDLEEPRVFRGGILLYNGDVVCGCCGGLFTHDEKGETWDIVEKFDNWIDFSNKII